MRILVKVAAGSRQERVEKINDKEFHVWVRQRALEGKANQGVIKLLSAYFDIPKSRVAIVSGHTGKHKVVDITIPPG